jgi:hypothetical protein
MKPSELSDEPYELDAFQRGFVFWEHPKPEYLPPTDDKGRQEWLEGFCQAHADLPPTAMISRAGKRPRRPLTGCWKGIRHCRR